MLGQKNRRSWRLGLHADKTRLASTEHGSQIQPQQLFAHLGLFAMPSTICSRSDGSMTYLAGSFVKSLNYCCLLWVVLLLTACMHAEPKAKMSTGALSVPPSCIKPGDSDLSNGEPNDGYYKVKTRWQQLACRYSNKPSRSLLVFLDGTANNKQTSTNIWRMYDLALSAADAGAPIIPYYDQGVGNDKLS